MKTIGMIGGTSWESTQTYYQYLNERTTEKLGGLHSAKCVLYSLEFGELYELIERGDWDRAGEISAEAAEALERAGADFLLLCANTSHKFCGAIERRVHIPILHIVDAVTAELRRRSLTTVGLLGTKYTMGEDFYISRLHDAGIRVLTPDAEGMEAVNRIIYDELCRGIVRDDSRGMMRREIETMRRAGAEGVILGCTELGMILRDGDAAIPLLDTVRIHSDAAVELALEGASAAKSDRE